MTSIISAIHTKIKSTSPENPFFSRIFYIPCVSAVVGIWKACILRSNINATTLEKDELTRRFMQPLKGLSKIADRSMVIDVLIAILAQTVLTASMPVFASLLTTVCSVSILGRLSVYIYCQYKMGSILMHRSDTGRSDRV